MPRIPGISRTRVSGQSGSPGTGPSISSFRQNTIPSGTIRRHQFRANATYNTTPGGPTITQQEYAYVELLRFRRTFGGTADVEPTPTAGTNNYGTTDVMNGSRIGKYNCRITLENTTGSDPVYLDVYMAALSFFDAHDWDAIYGAACPVAQNITYGSINGGQVTPDNPGVGKVDAQTIRESQFVQHYMKNLGMITVPSGADNGGTAEININIVPPKCRRIQTGTWWGIFFANDALRNQGNVECRIIADYNFDEIPSNNRIVEFPG